MSYRPLPLAAEPRPAAWRSLLLWALLSALALAGFSMLRALEGDADIVQAPPAQSRQA
ncbi:MAG TPA: hypothetical protein VK195_11350 [Burkholderiaceae bacterium]|nr:hypothetical protein [Burkholderiaceae bacterium]